MDRDFKHTLPSSQVCILMSEYESLASSTQFLALYNVITIMAMLSFPWLSVFRAEHWNVTIYESLGGPGYEATQIPQLYGSQLCILWCYIPFRLDSWGVLRVLVLSCCTKYSPKWRNSYAMLSKYIRPFDNIWVISISLKSALSGCVLLYYVVIIITTALHFLLLCCSVLIMYSVMYYNEY